MLHILRSGGLLVATARSPAALGSNFSNLFLGTTQGSEPSQHRMNSLTEGIDDAYRLAKLPGLVLPELLLSSSADDSVPVLRPPPWLALPPFEAMA
jgi:hypothetical protein